MVKIMYQKDSNTKPVIYRRVYCVHQAWKCMENEYREHRHYVATGDCTGLIVDLLPVETVTEYTCPPQSEFFPGYVIVGIKSRYCGIWDCWFIELA